MSASRKSIVIPILVLLLLVALWFGWTKRDQSAPAPARDASVVIKSMQLQPASVPVMIQATGYVTAVRRVEVRPQVQSVVREVHVQEGQQVKDGQLLVTLDARSDTSDVARAQAEVARAQAELAEAEASLRRNRELVQKKFVSQAALEADQNRVAALRSSVKAAQASLRTGQVGLGYNTIHASMGGRIGAINIHPGSLVQPAGEPILSIAQLDPIDVSFTVPERSLRYLLANASKSTQDQATPVQAQLADGRSVSGKLIFFDNAADPQSGTLKLKARFDNPEHAMWPGTYVSVSLVTHILPQALRVPAQAVIKGAEATTVYLVQPDKSVTQHEVQVETVQDGLAVITGLEPGVRVVIEGMQNLRPGVAVREATPAAATPAAEPAAANDDAA